MDQIGRDRYEKFECEISFNVENELMNCNLFNSFYLNAIFL